MKVMDYFYVSHRDFEMLLFRKRKQKTKQLFEWIEVGLTHGSILPALPSLGHQVTAAVKVTRGITSPPIHFIPATQWNVSQLPCAEHNSEIAPTIHLYPSNILLHSSWQLFDTVPLVLRKKKPCSLLYAIKLKATGAMLTDMLSISVYLKI